MPTKRYYLSDVIGTGAPHVDPFRPAIQDMIVAYGPLTGVSNTTPIVITAAGHALQTGDRVHVRNVLGNPAANGLWTITRTGANTFSLNVSAGSGAYTPGSGQWRNEGVTASYVLGSAVGAHALCQVNTGRHGVLSADVRVDIIPDATLNTLWGNIGTLAQRTAVISRLTARGWDVTGINDTVPYGLILRMLGRRYDPNFHELAFNSGG